MRIFDCIAWVLLIIGGLNWGLVALGHNIVDQIFGPGTEIAKIVYGLVGLSAIYAIFRSRCCSGSDSCKK